MPKKAKGLTRPISRAHARSYNRTRPNPGGRPRLGVTHLAELNGPGAYDEYHARYEATRRILDSNAEADQVAYTAKQQAAMKKMSPARKRAFKKMLNAQGGKKTRKKRSYRKNKYGEAARPAYVSYPKKPARVKAKRLSKKDFIARQKRKGRSPKQAEADWKLARGRPGKKKPAKKRGPATRRYGKYTAVKARMGPKSRWTYKYATKKGNLADIPDHALLGYPSRAAMKKAWMKGSEKERAALGRKRTAMLKRREREADRAAARIRAGKGLFTPNPEDVLSYEEWEEMTPNRKLTKKERSAAAKKGWRKRRRKAGAKKRKPAKRRAAAKRKPAKKRAKISTAKRRRAALKGWRKRRAKMRGGAKRRAAPRRKAKRRAVKRKGRFVKKGTPGARRTVFKARGKKMVRYRKNQGAYRVNRRVYRRNQGFLAELTGALKLGALVTAGFATHRALTHVIDAHGLSKIDALTTGKMADYRGIISGFLTAALGIGGVMATAKGGSKWQAPVAAGMAASFIHGAIVTVLKAGGADEAVNYLSNYPNAEGSTYGHAIGSYYTFKPHEVYSGMGSYYEIPQPMSGFGQPMLTQAAAGMGQPMLTQAAAGMGQPMLTQAAAGMGQITQAAAGTGEYVAYGIEGIGEYEEMPVNSMAAVTDEGIHPNLHAAEQALSVAEAAAGVGSAEVPLQSTVNPSMIADPISDLPGGSRAGVFQGGDGIFG